MRLTIVFLTFLMLAACRAITPDAPIVDTRGISTAQYEQDFIECEQFSDQTSVSADTGTGILGGAVVGGVLGAAVGNSSTAQRGAGVGAIVGGVRSAGSSVREKERVLRRCLTGRGYRVLN